jgi:hypothetical protein
MLHAGLVSPKDEADGPMIAIKAQPSSDAALYHAVASAKAEVKTPVKQRFDCRITEAKMRRTQEPRFRQSSDKLDQEIHNDTLLRLIAAYVAMLASRPLSRDLSAVKFHGRVAAMSGFIHESSFS